MSRLARRASSPISVKRAGDTKVEGLAELDRRAARLPDALRKALKKALEASGKDLVTTMKRIAPREEGDLLGSIESRQGPSDLSVMVVAGNEATPGKPVEHGHLALDGTKVRAKPFFWPAYRVRKKAIVGRMNRGGKAGINEALGTSPKGGT